MVSERPLLPKVSLIFAENEKLYHCNIEVNRSLLALIHVY